MPALPGGEEAQELLGTGADDREDHGNDQNHELVYEVGVTVIVSVTELNYPFFGEDADVLFAVAIHDRRMGRLHLNM